MPIRSGRLIVVQVRKGSITHGNAKGANATILRVVVLEHSFSHGSFPNPYVLTAIKATGG